MIEMGQHDVVTSRCERCIEHDRSDVPGMGMSETVGTLRPAAGQRRQTEDWAFLSDPGRIRPYAFHLHWDEESEQVISNVDRLGVVVLILYFIVAIYRRFFLEGYFEGAPLLLLTLAIIAGTMIGRLLTTIVMVRRILRRVGL